MPALPTNNERIKEVLPENPYRARESNEKPQEQMNVSPDKKEIVTRTAKQLRELAEKIERESVDRKQAA